MAKKLKGLKCKKFLATNLESLQKMINEFLNGQNIVLNQVRIEQAKYAIDEELIWP